MPPSLILPGLWQGSAPDMDDDAFMAGITHVVSATNVPCRRAHITCLHLGVKDDENAPIARHFARTVEFVHSARAAAGIVYVHCSQGVSRSSALVVAYLMVATGTTAAEALRYLILKRPFACPNIGFYRQLRSFEASVGAFGTLRRPDDGQALADVLATPEAAAVSVAAFEEVLGESESVSWDDRVVARAALAFETEDPSGGRTRHRTLAKGSTVRVLSTGPVDGTWRGQALPDGAKGTFARQGVRELDCASSEEEEEYQGGLGMLHESDGCAVSVGLQAWLLTRQMSRQTAAGMAAGTSNTSASLLEVAASRAAAARQAPSLKDLNSLFAAESIEPVSESEYLAFRDWAEAQNAVMDDEAYCDFRCELEADEPTPGPTSAVHQALDQRRRTTPY